MIELISIIAITFFACWIIDAVPGLEPMPRQIIKIIALLVAIVTIAHGAGFI